MRLLPLIVVLALAAKAADLPAATELVRKVAEAGPGASFRARGRLVETTAGGTRKVYQISVVQERLAGSTNLIWSVTGPPEARLKVLAESKPDGTTAVWRADGEGERAVVPERHRREAILGTRLTVEDLTDDPFRWPRQRVTGEGKCGARDCYVLVSREAEGTRASSYGSITSWVDRATFLPILVRKRPRGAGPAKSFQCLGVRQSGGRWVSTGVEITTAGTKGSTRITFTAGTVHAPARDRERGR